MDVIAWQNCRKLKNITSIISIRFKITLIFRCVLSHESIPPEQRKLLGITDSLVRLSVGIEDADDLIHDLKQAFEKIKK